MKKTSIFLLILINLIRDSVGFWPPEYKVHLHQAEEFVIADGFDENEDEDEMIKPNDLKEFDLEKDEDKYFRINKLARSKDKYSLVQKPSELFTKEPEENDYGIDEPAYGGFFDENDILEIEDDQNTFFANDKVRHSVENTVRRKRLELGVTVEKRSDDNESDYDYDALKAEYDAYIQKMKQQNDTFKYVEIKEEESVKESIKNILGIDKLPTNCTKEEENGIGLRAIGCFFGDMKKVQTDEDKLKLRKKLGKLCLIWFMVYVTIAIPCWCQRGWCCCCFRCKFCRPRERIEEAKRFLMQNPPGVLHENGKRIVYTPTSSEKYSHKRLKQALLKI